MKKEDDLKLWNFLTVMVELYYNHPSIILRKYYQYVRKYYVRKVK